MHDPRVHRRAAIFVAVLGVSALAAEKQATELFHAGANVVLINATVLDRNQRPVRGLTRDQFRLFENKAKQRITYFGEEEVPLSLAIVFDTSGSMEGKIAGASAGLRAMLEDAGRDDEFSLVTLADRAELAVPWTSDAVKIQNRAVVTKPRGRTALLDAIHLALAQLHTSRNPRRAILVLSDGGDNASRYTERQISRILEEADVQMYAIDMSPVLILHDRSPEEFTGPDLLERLCSRGGGRYFQVENQRDLTATTGQIAKEMRSQYVLGYQPPNSVTDGLFHQVQLKLLPVDGAPKLSVYWRRGYRAPRQ